MYLTWVIMFILIISIECAIWLIFRQKLKGLCFPVESDESFFRFFTRTRLKLITIALGVFLMGSYMIATYFLW